MAVHEFQNTIAAASVLAVSDVRAQMMPLGIFIGQHLSSDGIAANALHRNGSPKELC